MREIGVQTTNHTRGREEMYARVTFATAQPDKIDDVTKVMRDSVLPALKKQKGFKNMFFLVDRNAGKGMVIGLWNTEADMTAGESSGFYREQVVKVVPLLAGSPTLEHYEVSVKG
jgi:heme-degrading monooxygenase HmoA